MPSFVQRLVVEPTRPSLGWHSRRYELDTSDSSSYTLNYKNTNQHVRDGRIHGRMTLSSATCDPTVSRANFHNSTVLLLNIENIL